MKKVIILFAITLLSFTAYGKEQVIDYEQLPARARAIIERHFSKSEIVVVHQEGIGRHAEYEIDFFNGGELEFDDDGDLTSVEVKSGSVPADLIPQAIREAVEGRYSSFRIVKYKVERRGYEVELSNGLEIEFDESFNITKIDN